MDVKDGFYWGTLKIEIAGEKSGVVLVKSGIGYLYGWGLKVESFDFGSDPKPLSPPEWLISSKVANINIKYLYDLAK